MRKPRELKDGARYHVTARANRKEMILESARMKELFLEVVARAKKKYAFRVENFCIMGNHYHLMIRPEKGSSLSAIMQWIMGVFAMAWNRIHGMWGHVWGGRFFSRIITDLREYMQVFRYIDENPVKAGQVDHPEEWRFGGIWQRRFGRGDIIDLVPMWVDLLIPGHAVALLE